MGLLVSVLSAQPRQRLSCRDSCVMVQNDMGAVLEILLIPIRATPAIEPLNCCEHIIAALQMQDPKSGVTLLGQAVAWGYDEAIPPILGAVR